MLIAEIWQCCNIAKQKSAWAGNSSQTIRQVINKPPGKPNLFRREKEQRTVVELLPNLHFTSF